MSMSDSEYNKYAKEIDFIVDHGTKEGLEALYRRILAETGDMDNLKRLDSMHNSRWCIL